MASKRSDQEGKITIEANKLITKGSEGITTNAESALATIKKGLKISSENGVGWFNYGIALHQNKKISEAIRAYEVAIRSRNAPIDAATNNMAQDRLLNGDYNKGWELYDKRFKLMKTDFSIYDQMYGRPWEGFRDKRVLKKLIVVAEQGYGDTIQFCRLVTYLNDIGINASLFCQEALVPMLRKSSMIKDIEVSIRNKDPNTLWCPLLSLPRKLKLEASNIPYAEGYLKPCDKEVDRWRRILRRSKGKKLVAIHWQGNESFERNIYSHGRSMAIEDLETLTQLQNVEFVSVQKGKKNIENRLRSGLSFVAGQRKVDESLDFEETMSVLANCELLISTDSSVVHLAGAIGLETWVALNWVPEWRWGLDGKKTAWYTSMQLFRKQKNEKWSDVIYKMVKQYQEGIETE